MWHNIRRLLTGPGQIPAEPERGRPSLPPGYLNPEPAPALLATENRQHLLQQLWENSPLTHDHYSRYFLGPLQNCVSLIQQLPAAASGHYAVQGGMVDLTLNTVVCAVRLSRGYMLPPGASAEDQSAQSASWAAVVFYAALFHSLASLRHIEGELLNGEPWSPGITVPGQPYRFRFRREPPDDRGGGLRTMLGMRLLPAEIILWLSKTPAALDALLACIRGDPEHAGAVARIVEDAIRHAGGETPARQPEVPSVQTPPALTGAAAPLPVTGEGSAETSLVPVTDEPVFSDNGAGALPDGKMMLSSALDEPAVSPPSVRTDSIDPAVGDVLSIMGLTPDTGATEPETTVPVPEAGDTVQPPVAAAADGEVKPGTVSDDIYGQQFVDWLQTGISAGSIAVNTKEAQVHITGGLVFLPAPELFFAFMKEMKARGLPPPPCKNAVQSGFERLGLHHIRKGKGIFSCMKYREESRRGSHEKVSGYLIKAKTLYVSHPVPDDSPFLFVSAGSGR